MTQHDDTEPHVSYMRGDIYVWSSDRQTHFWVRKPEDAIDDWVHGCEFAAGVALDNALIDEFVAMRWAEMSMAERKQAERRAVERWDGNVGCAALRRRVGMVTGGPG